MSDPEVPQPEQPADVNDVVDSAKAGLADAAAAGAEVPGVVADGPADAPAGDAAAAADAPVDPDLAAFEEAEKSHPGTFAPVEPDPVAPVGDAAPVEASEIVVAPEPVEHSIADEAYASAAGASAFTAAETQVVPAEPTAVVAPAPQPIFVQAPEPPRERGNRGTAAAIGLLATLAFAILMLATSLGLGAAAGDVTGENIGEAALAPLTTWGFWVPVVVFFLGFWLLGAIINRGRWGLWVVFGIVVGVVAYGGHILGQLFEAPFWNLTASEGSALVGEQLLAPLAIAAFVFGRELSIWFGAWVARSGARKTELNAEAQREYERTLEAGPTLSR